MFTIIRKYSPLWWMVEAIAFYWIGYAIKEPILVTLSIALLIAAIILFIVNKDWVRMLVYAFLSLYSIGFTFFAWLLCAMSVLRSEFRDIGIAAICLLNMALSFSGFWRNWKQSVLY